VCVILLKFDEELASSTGGLVRFHW